MPEILSDELHGLLFGIRRSIRYHYRKVRFFDRFNKIATFLSALTGTATLTAVLAKAAPAITLSFAGLVTFFSIIDLVVGTAQRARDHNDFAKRYFRLEKEIICIKDPKEKDLAILKGKRIDIEINEPPPGKIIDAMCHNEVVRAYGYDDKCLVKIRWYQRFFAHFFDIREHTLEQPK